jgi:hypothetical protein
MSSTAPPQFPSLPDTPSSNQLSERLERLIPEIERATRSHPDKPLVGLLIRDGDSIDAVRALADGISYSFGNDLLAALWILASPMPRMWGNTPRDADINNRIMDAYYHYAAVTASILRQQALELRYVAPKLMQFPATPELGLLEPETHVSRHAQALWEALRACGVNEARAFGPAIDDGEWPAVLKLYVTDPRRPLDDVCRMHLDILEAARIALAATTYITVQWAESESAQLNEMITTMYPRLPAIRAPNGQGSGD